MTTTDDPKPETPSTPAPAPRSERPSALTEQTLTRLAWFSLVATSTTLAVSMAVILVGVGVALSEPEPAVFDHELPPLRIVDQRTLPPMGAPAAPEVAPAPPTPVVPPELPEDLALTEALVPGQLPGVAPSPAPVDAPEAAPPEDTAVQAPAALQSDRVTIGIATEPSGADVRVDGRFRGRTPVKLMLNPGRYDITLSVQSIEAQWALEATTNERKCFSVQGSELLPIECS